MVPEISSSSFWRSARAARGRPQFATYKGLVVESYLDGEQIEHTGPQK